MSRVVPDGVAAAGARRTGRGVTSVRSRCTARAMVLREGDITHTAANTWYIFWQKWICVENSELNETPCCKPTENKTDTVFSGYFHAFFEKRVILQPHPWQKPAHTFMKKRGHLTLGLLGLGLGAVTTPPRRRQYTSPPSSSTSLVDAKLTSRCASISATKTTSSDAPASTLRAWVPECAAPAGGSTTASCGHCMRTALCESTQPWLGAGVGVGVGVGVAVAVAVAVGATVG